AILAASRMPSSIFSRPRKSARHTRFLLVHTRRSCSVRHATAPRSPSASSGVRAASRGSTPTVLLHDPNPLTHENERRNDRQTVAHVSPIAAPREIGGRLRDG